jgi:hypothetical protein
LIVHSGAFAHFVLMGGDLWGVKPEDMESVPPAKKFRYLCEDGKSFTLRLNTVDNS